MDYIARQLIWHTGEMRYYAAGERVPLKHLDDKTVADLMSAGIIVPADRVDWLMQVVTVPGPEYARLLEVGILDPNDLATADPAVLSASLGIVSQTQIRMWQAKIKTIGTKERGNTCPEQH